MIGISHIVIAMKPVESGFAENALKHGVSGLNVDGARVEAVGGRPGRVIDAKETVNNVFAGRMNGSLAGGSKAVGDTTLGRWPANVILGHSEKCVLKGIMRVKGTLCDKPSDCKMDTGATEWGTIQGKRGVRGYGDADGKETVENWECVEGCPVRLLGEQSGARKAGKWNRTEGMRPFNNDEGTAARYFKQIKEYEDETSGREQDEGR
jgi:hypothetical protein